MKQKISDAILKASIITATLITPVIAADDGGLTKVNTFVTKVTAMLSGISVGVVTVAIMWAGYKFLFKHADLAEVGKIVAGGLLIGGAAQLSSYLLT